MRITIILILCLGFIPNKFVYADCTCKPVEITTAYNTADLIIEGEVVRITTNWISGGWKYTFKIDRSWKRSTDRVLFINSPWEKDCGSIFEEGKSYIVFIDKGFTMKTQQCMGNVLVEEADATLSYLEEGTPPTASPQVPYINFTLIILGVLALLFMAVVVLRKKIFPTR